MKPSFSCERIQAPMWHAGVAVTYTLGNVSVHVQVFVPDPKVLGDAATTIEHAEAIGLGKDAQRFIEVAARDFLGGRYLLDMEEQ